ncbi:MAG: LysR family transcriptional regulator, partial [Rhodobacteraceae bacterium]|nr:LysR family transcriptional regulator [Paracoccaceae bacterium]
LERRLGRELFVRLPRGYGLTEAGSDLLAKAAALEGHINPMVEAEQPLPVVKISAGTWVTHILCGQLPALVGQDPIRLRFIAADERLDIGRRAALIGIRNQRPEAVGLAGRKIGRVRFAAYATNDNVQNWARVIGPTPSARWVDALPHTSPPIDVTSPRNALDLALAGSARVVLPTFIGMRQTGLARVSPLIDGLEHEQWLVTHHEDRFLPEIRAVIDRVYRLLKETCARN